MRLDCYRWERWSCKCIFLGLLPLGLDLILKALLLGFLQVSSCINLIIFLHLRLHYLLVISFLWQIRCLHTTATGFRFSTLCEEVFTLRGQETTAPEPTLMILVLTIDDPFALEKLLLGCEFS